MDLRWDGSTLVDAYVQDGYICVGETKVKAFPLVGGDQGIIRLIDLLRPLFGLKSYGTHWIGDHLYGKPVGNLVHIEDVPVLGIDYKMRLEIQEILAFREIIGLSTRKGYLLAYYDGGEWHPYTRDEGRLKMVDRDKRFLPKSMLRSWFRDEEEFCCVARRLLTCDPLLRVHLETVRDRTFAWITNQIVRRGNALLSCSAGVLFRDLDLSS